MKNFRPLLTIFAILMLHGAIRSSAQSTTAFTYQGQLTTANGPATGSYDMSFAVYDANLGGDLIAGPITNSAVAVNNGLFTATLDFGSNVFTGTNYWVQMAVSPAGAGTFSTLVPRQPLTPTPYAISLVAPQVNALCPPGSVMAYMGTNAPPGWLICDGTAYSRTTYSALFAVLGTASGAGDGSTTFNLPDMRGLFLRGVNGTRNDGYNDPDANNGNIRTNIYPGGALANAVGSYETDQFLSHNHIEGSSEGVGEPRDIYGVVQTGSSIWGDNQYSAMNTAHAYTSMTGGNETRPRNVFVNYIIKY